MTDNEPLHGMYDPTQHGKVFEMANGILTTDAGILAGLREQKLPYAIVDLGGGALVWTTPEAYKKVDHLHSMTRTPLAATAQQAKFYPDAASYDPVVAHDRIAELEAENAELRKRVQELEAFVNWTAHHDRLYGTGIQGQAQRLMQERDE